MKLKAPRGLFTTLLIHLRNPSSLWGASFQLIIAQGIGFLTLLILDLWLVRQLSQTDFGIWKQFIWMVRFIIPLFYFGLPDSYRYFSAVDKNQYNKHFYNILNLIIINGFLWIGLERIHLLDYLVLLTKNSVFSQILWLIPLLMMFSAIKFLFRIHAIFLKNPQKIVSANSIFSIILIFVCIIMVQSRENFLLILGVGWLIAEIIRILYYSFQYLSTLSLPAKWYKITYKQIKKYLKYGIPYYFSSTIFLIFTNVDKMIVSMLGGAEKFAVFSIAAIEIPFLTSVFVSVSQNLFPRLAEVNKTNPQTAFKLWFSVFKKISYLIYPILIVLIWIAKPIFVFLFTEKYSSGVVIFKIYIFLLIWRTASYSILLNASGRPQVNLLLNSIFLCLNFIGSYVLYQYYGMTGVVWSTLVSFSLLNISILIYLRQFGQFLKLIKGDKILLSLMITLILSFIGSLKFGRLIGL